MSDPRRVPAYAVRICYGMLGLARHVCPRHHDAGVFCAWMRWLIVSRLELRRIILLYERRGVVFSCDVLGFTSWGCEEIRFTDREV